MLVDHADEIRLVRQTDDGFLQIAVLEKQQRGNAADHVVGRRHGVLVHVHLGDAGLARELGATIGEFTRRGAMVSAAVLAGLLSKEAASSAAPAALFSALTPSLAAGVGVTVTPMALLANSAVKGMFWAKAKLAAAIVATAATVAVAPVVVHQLVKDRPIDWRTLTTERATLAGHSAEVGSVEFSPDGKLIATGSYDGTAKIWDAATGAEKFHLKPNTGKIDRIAFSPDSKVLAMSTRSQAPRLWDTATGQELTELKASYGDGSFVAFARDGRLLASSTRNDVKLWDLPGQTEVATLKGHTQQVNPGSTFSPDGTLLATGSYDTTVRVWDVAKKQERWVLRGHTNCVPCLSFAPDGKSLASIGRDGAERLAGAPLHDPRQLRVARGIVDEAAGRGALGRVRQDVTDGGRRHGEVRHPSADGLVDVQRSPLGAFAEEHGRHALRQPADGVGRVGRGRDRPVDVLQPESTFPLDAAVLHDGRREARDAGLLPQRVEITLEQGIGKLALGRPRMSWRQTGAHPDKNGKQTTIQEPEAPAE